MENAYAYVFGKTNYDEFISAHEFYYRWFISYRTDKQNFPDIVFVKRLNIIVNESNDEVTNNAQLREVLRVKISQLLDTIESVNTL